MESRKRPLENPTCSTEKKVIMEVAPTLTRSVKSFYSSKNCKRPYNNISIPSPPSSVLSSNELTQCLSGNINSDTEVSVQQKHSETEVSLTQKHSETEVSVTQNRSEADDALTEKQSPVLKQRKYIFYDKNNIFHSNDNKAKDNHSKSMSSITRPKSNEKLTVDDLSNSRTVDTISSDTNNNGIKDENIPIKESSISDSDNTCDSLFNTSPCSNKSVDTEVSSLCMSGHHSEVSPLQMSGQHSEVSPLHISEEDTEALSSSFSSDYNFSSQSNIELESEKIKLAGITPSTNKNTLFSYFKKDKTYKSDKLKNVIRLNNCKTIDALSTCRQTKLKEIDSSLLLTPSEDVSMFNLPLSPNQQGMKRRKKLLHPSNKGIAAAKQQKKEQMYLDIGQKNLGHVTCTTCGMIYTKSQEEDEAHHAKHHDKITQKLKFNGWKTERLIGEYHDGRIIAIYGDDCLTHKRKLSLVKEVVDDELGFDASKTFYNEDEQKGFLFVSGKKVIGCVIAVPLQKAFPIIESDVKETVKDGELSCSWCCSTEAKSALCGISRIWVFSQNRRQNIATRLVDAIRHHFIYGCIIEKHKLAFSDPTPNGRAFAISYVGKDNVLVFR